MSFDLQVLFGTSKGQILVNDVHGELVTQVSVIKDTPIIAMAWSCEKFKMEESELDGQQACSSENQTSHGVILAVAFESGIIYLMKNYDDLNPIVLHTGLKGGCFFRPTYISKNTGCETKSESNERRVRPESRESREGESRKQRKGTEVSPDDREIH